MGVGGLSQEMHKAWAQWGKLGHIHSQGSVTPSLGKGANSFLGEKGHYLCPQGYLGDSGIFERIPGLVNLQFHTEQGSGCGSATETLPLQAPHWAGPGRKARRELWPAVTRPKRLEVEQAPGSSLGRGYQPAISLQRSWEGQGRFRAGKGTGTDTGKGT